MRNRHGERVSTARGTRNEKRGTGIAASSFADRMPLLEGAAEDRKAARTFRKTDSSSFFSFASCRFRQDGDAFYHFINRVIFPNFFQQVFESAMQINGIRVSEMREMRNEKRETGNRGFRLRRQKVRARRGYGGQAGLGARG